MVRLTGGKDLYGAKGLGRLAGKPLGGRSLKRTPSCTSIEKGQSENRVKGQTLIQVAYD